MVSAESSGLLHEKESDLRSDESLRKIYEERFQLVYGLNFLNLVDRPSVDVTQLRKGKEQPGVRRLLKAIKTYRPKVVCFIGKIAFNTFRGSRNCDWGWQDDIEGTPAYLMHFPIRGLAEARIQDLLEIKEASE